MFNTVLVTDFDTAETISASIRNFHTGIIGFDTETNSKNLHKDPVDVIQICVPSDNPEEVPTVYIFHVSEWPRVEYGKNIGRKKLPESLSKIISSKRIVKVASAPENDSSWLWKAFEVKLLAVIDIQSMAMLRGETAFGLDSLASKYLEGWTNKDVNTKMAEWDKPLSPRMIKYAANDAYASYALMKVFEPSFGSRKEGSKRMQSLDLFISKSEEMLKKSGLLEQEKKSIHKIVSKILESIPDISNDRDRRDTAKTIFDVLRQRGVVSYA
jgi:hypothetical protein